MAPMLLVAFVVLGYAVQPGLVIWVGIWLRLVKPGTCPRQFVVRKVLAPIKVEAALLFLVIVTILTDLVDGSIPSWVWTGLVTHLALQAAAWVWVIPAARWHFNFTTP